MSWNNPSSGFKGVDSFSRQVTLGMIRIMDGCSVGPSDSTGRKVRTSKGRMVANSDGAATGGIRRVQQKVNRPAVGGIRVKR